MGDQGNSGGVWLFVKVTLFTLLVPGTVVGLVPYLLLDDPSPGAVDWLGWAALGVAPIALGAALYLRCAYDFMLLGRGTPAPVDAPVRLVVDGPYGYCRNPMYVGILAILAGEALLFREPALLAYLLTMAVVFQIVVVGYEERVLGRRFGDDFARYRAAVPRWIPDRSGLEALYRRSFLEVGALVLTAGAVAHVVRLTVGLPLLEMPVSIHAPLVILPAYALAGCLAYARRLDLEGAARKLTFALVVALLATTVVMHVYSIAADTNEWYRVFPMWYSVVSAVLYAAFARFLKTRTVKDDPEHAGRG